jgi:secreted trypsin-like serine protease
MSAKPRTTGRRTASHRGDPLEQDFEWSGDEYAGAVAAEQAAIAQLIRSADAASGKDNRGFVRTLNDRYAARMADRERGGSLPVISAEAPTKSFQIYSDPRYLNNARELARRTLGGERIIGGVPVKPPEFLDCVAVGNDAQWGCSGTLIGPNVVVTAGHCADYATRVFFGYDVAKKGLQVRVKRRVRHPQYHKTRHNDLMVLVLEKDVETVAPRRIASKTRIDKATDGRVVGFGHADAAGMFGYGIKRMVDVPIATVNCQGTVGSQNDNMTYGCDRGFELVAGRPLLERDSCRGDSGGPIYIAESATTWTLAAATSRATDSAMHTCGDGGIYVRLDRYLPWIRSIPAAKLS